MIDLACIFTVGGVILFLKQFCQTKCDLIEHLIIKNLIVDQSSENSYFFDPYRIHYLRINEYGIIMMVAYQEFLQLEYMNYLLKLMKKSFIEKILPKIIIEKGLYKIWPQFDNEFSDVFDKWKTYVNKEKQKQKLTKSFYETSKGQELLKTTQQKNEKAQKKNIQIQEEKQQNLFQKNNNDNNKNEVQQLDKQIEANEIKKNIENLKKRFSKKTKENDQSQNSKPITNLNSSTKEMRQDLSGKITKQKMDSLDASKKNNELNIEELKEKYLDNNNENVKIKGFYDENENSDDDELMQINQNNNNQKKKNLLEKFTNTIKTFTGNKILDEQDIQPILDKFKEDLMGKNVAEAISQILCESIKSSLLQTKSKAFISIKSIIKESLKSSITKILTPKKNIDIIAEAMRNKEQGKPYSIVFIGVNGVGKSTNLAKIAYLFKNQKFSVMIAACDNFRAGAVEQVKTHGRCLDIPVYDRGYKEDPAEIAFQAIREATLKKIEVVLIDTAGRMQDNEPLMKALARLVAVNNPDLILFIGEALVGNDAIDQLTKFNKSLIDLSPKNNIREIDAIILSKFDTVDDKVGAAITMTYTTGKPILFVGIGQKYIHLKKLNVKTIVHSLLN